MIEDKEYIKRQSQHQLQCDLRIRNQRATIHALEIELKQARTESSRLRKAMDELKSERDRPSEFWEIDSLKQQNTLLHARLKAAREFLSGGVAEEIVRKYVVRTTPQSSLR